MEMEILMMKFPFGTGWHVLSEELPSLFWI